VTIVCNDTDYDGWDRTTFLHRRYGCFFSGGVPGVDSLLRSRIDRLEEDSSRSGFGATGYFVH
jgi:hypothetical protein